MGKSSYRRKPRLSSKDKLVTLFENEINWEMSCFYDGGYTVRLGDEMNGYVAQEGYFRKFDEAADWLWKTAREKFPKARCFDPAALN